MVVELARPREKWRGGLDTGYANLLQIRGMPTGADLVVRAPLVLGDSALARDTHWSFPPLPGAQQEAPAVASMLRTTPLLGRAASLAATAVCSPAVDLLYLTTREVQVARLRARLAILAVCQTDWTGTCVLARRSATGRDELGERQRSGDRGADDHDCSRSEYAPPDGSAASTHARCQETVSKPPRSGFLRCFRCSLSKICIRPVSTY
jgi:hypothetical protein